MITVVLLAAIAAPEEAEAKLRVAWASQYEWSESDVKNAKLAFTYSHVWKGPGDRETRYEGHGEIVAVGAKIVRRHFPGASTRRSSQIRRHLEWVLGRFARLPFEEHFKEHVFSGPENTGDGLLRITAAPASKPKDKSYYYVKDDRLVRFEWGIGRMDYETGDVGDGYAILGETVSWAVKDLKTKTSRLLKVAAGADYPYPEKYVYRLEAGSGTTEVRFHFSPPTVNAKHPVIGEPEARDALRAAWARRFVLPAGTKIQAQFQRRVDSDLANLHWLRDVKGDVQLWGLDNVKVEFDARLFPDVSWIGESKRLCEEHFRGMFRWLRDRPFEQEFAECGFRFAPSADETQVVLVQGCSWALGFRLEDGRLAGYLRNLAHEEDWWRFRLKKTGEDRFRIDSMKAKLGKKTCTLKFKYARRKGTWIVTRFDALGGPRWEREGEGHGVANYQLKKVKVTLPDPG